jgi:hypothetical protein
MLGRTQASVRTLRTVYEQLTADPRAAAFYDKFPRNVFWAQENRRCSTEIMQNATDLQDLVRRMQKTLLFGVNTETDLKGLAVDWLIAKYKECGIDLDAMSPALEESPYSSPSISVERSGRRLSVDFLRTVSVASDIRRYIQRNGPGLSIVELGAGLGHLARTLRIMGVSRSHLILDLPESLVFSFAFLTLNFPEAKTVLATTPEEIAGINVVDYDFVFIPSCFAEYVDFTGVELFVNTASLGEMRNQSIRYWMDFVQNRMPVKHLFTQNRYLNTIDPLQHAWRCNENEASLLYDQSWTVLKWELEPVWFRCPYVVPISSRDVEIAATRESIPERRAAEIRSRDLLEEVKLQDWYRSWGSAGHMSMRQNVLVTDLTMTGTLFKLWESIRLHPTAEALLVLLSYFEILIHDQTLIFEEAPYYRRLLESLAAAERRPDLLDRATNLRRLKIDNPILLGVQLKSDTRDYNLVRLEVLNTESVIEIRYVAVAKSLGPIDLLLERFGDREHAPYILMADSLECIAHRAKVAEATPH